MSKSSKAVLATAVFSALSMLWTAPALAGAQPYIGEIQCTGSTFAPAGFLPLEGQLLSIADYPTLFNLIGTIYGGDGQNTFALPDMRGRAIVAADTTNGGYVPGATGGTENFTVTASTMPAHSHGFAAPAATATANKGSPIGAASATKAPVTLYAAGNAATTQMAQSTTSSVGSSIPVDNTKPYVAVTCYIAVFGIYPTQ